MIHVQYQGGTCFTAATRGHEVVTDLAPEKGGRDQGMTPPELLVSSFGTCVGVYVTQYLKQVGIDPTGTTIDVTYETAEQPLRISCLCAKVHVPVGIPEQRMEAVRKVAEKCLIHQTLCFKPDVTIEIT